MTSQYGLDKLWLLADSQVEKLWSAVRQELAKRSRTAGEYRPISGVEGEPMKTEINRAEIRIEIKSDEDVRQLWQMIGCAIEADGGEFCIPLARTLVQSGLSGSPTARSALAKLRPVLTEAVMARACGLNTRPISRVEDKDGE